MHTGIHLIGNAGVTFSARQSHIGVVQCGASIGSMVDGVGTVGADANRHPRRIRTGQGLGMSALQMGFQVVRMAGTAGLKLPLAHHGRV